MRTICSYFISWALFSTILGALFAIATAIIVNETPASAGAPVLEAFVSYSIEFVFFPDFAGNTASPNNFSNNLLSNIGQLQGTKPYIRVGGNTQDFALYDASLKVAVKGTYNFARSSDYPTTISIGPSFFESYNTFPDTKYVHGFNLGQGGISAAGYKTLIDTAPLACKALGKNKLLWWEYGNEADLYYSSSPYAVRSSSWHEQLYVAQWLNGTRAIEAQINRACPELLGGNYGYLAPSFAGTRDYLKPLPSFQNGLNTDNNIKLISYHNYISGANVLGVTLQGTLMNHSSTIISVNRIASSSSTIQGFLAQQKKSSIPAIIGEGNSLYNQGRSGLSNSFGAALWGLDFNLYCASVNISRVHMHQGTDYRYAAWQPIQTHKTTIGTKPPYYGSVAVAAFIGDVRRGKVQIASLPLDDPLSSAYAAYVNSKLARIAIINMHAYNYTLNGTGHALNPNARPQRAYSFQIPEYVNGSAQVMKLYANGSDAITGVSWDGWSYNWELNRGLPVRLQNVTTGKRVKVVGGVVSVLVEDSTAVVLSFGA